MVWYLGIKSIVTGDYNILAVVINKFGENKEIEEEEIHNEDDYELVDVEVIK